MYCYILYYPKVKLQELVGDFLEGIPDHESLISIIDNNTHQSNYSLLPDHQFLVFEYLLCDLVSTKDDLMLKLFKVYANHNELSVIMLSRKRFEPGDYKFIVHSENVHYIFRFKSKGVLQK